MALHSGLCSSLYYHYNTPAKAVYTDRSRSQEAVFACNPHVDSHRISDRICAKHASRFPKGVLQGRRRLAVADYKYHNGFVHDISIFCDHWILDSGSDVDMV